MHRTCVMCVHTQTCRWIDHCVCVEIRDGLHLSSSIACSLPYCLRRGFLLTWCLSFWLDQLASDLKGFSCVPPSHPAAQVFVSLYSALAWVQEIQTQVLMFPQQVFGPLRHLTSPIFFIGGLVWHLVVVHIVRYFMTHMQYVVFRVWGNWHFEHIISLCWEYPKSSPLAALKYPSICCQLYLPNYLQNIWFNCISMNHDISWSTLPLSFLNHFK